MAPKPDPNQPSLPLASAAPGPLRTVTTAYGAPATAVLSEEIRAAQQGNPLAPVTVVIPSNRAGLAARRALGAAGGLANVAFLTPFALADQLGAARAARLGSEHLTEPILLAAIRVELRAQDGFFAPVATHAGTERALARRYAELSRARPETVERIRRAGSPRAQALVELFERVRTRLAPYSDEDAIATHAQAALEAGDPSVAGLGTVIVHLPQPPTPALGDLVAAVVQSRPGVLIVGLTGDTTADAAVREVATRFGGELPAISDSVVAPTGTEIITASDVDEEVRAVIRRLLALAEAGVPFDRMAVLSPAVEPYARTIDAQLTAAGIAHNGPAVRILADTMAGRVLDRIVALVGAKFARDELVALFASTPVRTPDGKAVPIDRWDRISRRAGVVDGDDWERRLADHARELDERAVDRDATGVRGSVGLRQEAAAARALAAYVANVRAHVDDLERASGWADRAALARAAVLDLLGGPDHGDTWPATEYEALDAVLDALERCAGLDAIEPNPAFATFAGAVTMQLRVAANPVGRYGNGVLCASIGTSVGLDLDAVFVVGVAEGLMPRARREDALLADADRAVAIEGELTTRDHAIADQRRAYLTALAAGAVHRVLSYARGDLRSSRERLPSRYLLESASALAGARVFASEFAALDTRAGVDVVPSFAAGISRAETAANLVERDLGTLAGYVAAGGDVLAHPLVAASPAAAGVEAIRGRASTSLTRWDGNVGAVADRVPSPATGTVVSATRLERWSTCPFRYFLADVLRIPVEDEPERLLELSPLDRGTLVHAVLEQLVSEELARPDAERIPVGQPWPSTAVDRARELVDEFAADAEARGLTGKAVLWSLHREEIETDVETFLMADNVFRTEQGAIPESVEFPFGFDDAPAVEITTPNGAAVRFRGRADRIDVLPDGTRVVLDYKTGRKPRPPDGCEEDPVWAGARLQLPLYAEAARQCLGVESVDAAYWYISQRGGFVRDEISLDDATTERFREVVGQIVSGIDGGIFPAAPGEPSWLHNTDANCAYCDFDALCPVDRGAQYDAKEDAPEFEAFHELMPEVEA